MLTKYKNDYAKIAMGFLSFIPDLKDIDHLRTELTLYTADNSHALFLYREAPGEDFEGVVGVELGQDYVMVRHLSLSPAVRSDETKFTVLRDLCAQYPDKKLMGTMDNASLIASFQKARKEALDGTDLSAE
ncbi:N-acetyltransferase [Lacticaseibacillus jixianensis]|uniref:N-acetyltransferase n=1 Tax=Lacticaseibacillus jixianensis TaxID=2486012 RepID=A0ABW4B748_9LACO|nr:N-acetyltransferase [Lacticaseibacillus jixianensis]